MLEDVSIIKEKKTIEVKEKKTTKIMGGFFCLCEYDNDGKYYIERWKRR